MSARSIRRMNQRNARRRARRVAGAALGASLALVPAADAATFTVDSSADGPAGPCGLGNCTLRDALDQANSPANPGLDQIAFAGTVTSITLTAGELPITTPVAIAAPGAAQVTIDANDASR